MRLHPPNRWCNRCQRVAAEWKPVPGCARRPSLIWLSNPCNIDLSFEYGTSECFTYL